LLSISTGKLKVSQGTCDPPVPIIKRMDSDKPQVRNGCFMIFKTLSGAIFYDVRTYQSNEIHRLRDFELLCSYLKLH
jgi:hypothetical protein